MTTLLVDPAPPERETGREPGRRPGLPFLDPDLGPAEVHVISGSFGAGHDAAAREIAIRLTAEGHLVRVWDIVDFFPARLGRLLRAAYLKQLEISPSSWGALLRRLEPSGLLHRAVTGALAITSRRLTAVAAKSDLVISTHPFASQALGRLRSRGRFHVPVVTYLTDLSVHPLWVHRGVDLHLALHEVAARQARSWGGEATVIDPLVPRALPGLLPEPALAAEYRMGWGLAPDARIALVVGGSMGIGELASAAVDIAATGLAVPVVVCGHNTALVRRLSDIPGVVALGWRDDLPALLSAADCVIQNAGGFTSLEAMAAGVPVITYRCLPGHGMSNAEALQEAGLVPWARGVEDLRQLLLAALAGPWLPRISGGRSTLVSVLSSMTGSTT